MSSSSAFKVIEFDGSVTSSLEVLMAEVEYCAERGGLSASTHSMVTVPLYLKVEKSGSSVKS